MKTKGFTKVEVKDADQGLVTAVFATLNVVDSDGDVTLPGAFTEGEAVRISAYGHTSWSGKLPVGRGTIKEIGNEAILEGRFFLGTTEGRETFEVVKEMSESPGLQEWSYGFDVLDGAPGTFEGNDVYFLRKMKVHEVSPVLLGAGVDTRTLAVKGTGTLTDQLHLTAQAVLEVTKDARQRAEYRAKEGAGLSNANRDALDELVAALHKAQAECTEILGSRDDGAADAKSDDTFPGLDLEAMFTTLRR